MKRNFNSTCYRLFAITFLLTACGLFNNSKVLYISSLENANLLVEDYEVKVESGEQSYRENFIYPFNGDVRVYKYPLTGDIDGDEYEFNIFAACQNKSVIEVGLVLQSKTEKIQLANAKLEIIDSKYKYYTSSIKGIDPASVKGDTLLFTIQCKGTMTAYITDTSDKDETSFIEIPVVN